MTPPTIHQLRARGFKVRVMHERVTGFDYVTPNLLGSPPKLIEMSLVEAVPHLERVTKEGKKAKQYSRLYEKGGRTTIEVTPPGGSAAHDSQVEVAQCSIKDPFNRKRGNLICLGRLQKRGVI